MSTNILRNAMGVLQWLQQEEVPVLTRQEMAAIDKELLLDKTGILKFVPSYHEICEGRWGANFQFVLNNPPPDFCQEVYILHPTGGTECQVVVAECELVDKEPACFRGPTSLLDTFRRLQKEFDPTHVMGVVVNWLEPDWVIIHATIASRLRTHGEILDPADITEALRMAGVRASYQVQSSDIALYQN